MATRDMVAGALIGAGLVWFLDADRGAARRARYGDRLGDLAGLEAATLRAPGGASTRQAAMGLAVLGGVLTLFGLTRRGRTATVARTLGAGMLAGGVTRAPAPAGPERRRVVDVQKSVHIAAPVAEVFGFWDSYESFPLFLSSVRDVVDLGGGRSRWVVAGPGGAPIEWHTTLIARQPGRLLAWRSEPGSMLDHAGAIRFTPEQGGTRVDLRLCYQPPAGGADQAVSELLGTDPRVRLNDDLERLRSVLEATVRRDTHGQEPRS